LQDRVELAYSYQFLNEYQIYQYQGDPNLLKEGLYMINIISIPSEILMNKAILQAGLMQ
jgi:hypothetical protein